MWLEYIDYALIKVMIDLSRFKELERHFMDCENIYVSNATLKLKEFMKIIERDVTDEKLRNVLLAYMAELAENYSASLEYWRKIFLSPGSKDSKTASQYAVNILIRSAKRKDVFFDLFTMHISWIAGSKEAIVK